MKREVSKKLYESKLKLIETEIAIKKIKDFFETNLAKQLKLTRVSAPLFLKGSSGLNDNLNGVEKPIEFSSKDTKKNLQIVHSLAKWKRYALDKYEFKKNTGLYADMNAIRKDEILDNLHSLYVDQWDWEKIITTKDREIEFLKKTVKKIYDVFLKTEEYISKEYPAMLKKLPEKIHFMTSQELEDMYPELSTKDREDKISKKYLAVCIMKIGGVLKSGIKHDGRSPDYDDWELNGDIIFYNPILDCAFEVSSMGIRVDKKSMLKQLKISKAEDRKKMPFHKAIIEEKLPLTIGGGIGQSRICMFFLDKAHIGEVQSSHWSEKILNECEKNNIFLL